MAIVACLKARQRLKTKQVSVEQCGEAKILMQGRFII
jgi:hypothetical protein